MRKIHSSNLFDNRPQTRWTLYLVDVEGLSMELVLDQTCKLVHSYRLESSLAWPDVRAGNQPRTNVWPHKINWIAMSNFLEQGNCSHQFWRPCGHVYFQCMCRAYSRLPKSLHIQLCCGQHLNGLVRYA